MDQVMYHIHNGLDSPRIEGKDVRNIQNSFDGLFFQTVSEIPTYTPTSFYDQLCLYVDGGDALLYVYDIPNSTWRRFNYFTTP